jgi:hypothetical protein
MAPCGRKVLREKEIVQPRATGERCHRDLMYCDRKVKFHHQQPSVPHTLTSIAASLRCFAHAHRVRL